MMAVGHTGIGWRQAHYQALLERRPALPFVEVHSENFFADGGAALALLTRARAHYPVSLHGVGLSLGSACGIDPWHLEQLVRLVQRIEPVRVSDHACFARVAWPGVPGGVVHGADLLPLPFSREALQVLVRNVQQVQEALQRPIAVENLSAYVQWDLPHGDGPSSEPESGEPEFLNALAAQSGCHLLVDVNNLYVNALNAPRLGSHQPWAEPLAACRAWLDALRPGPVSELHLAGHCQRSDGWVIDDHGSAVCPEVWQIYQHALQRWGTRPTVVEWDTDVPALDVLLAEAARADACA